MKISTKLLILNLLLMVVFTTLVLGAVILQGDKLATTGSKIRIENNLDYTNSMMELYLSNAQTILRGYANDPEMISAFYETNETRSSLASELTQIVDITNELKSIAVIGNDGVLRIADKSGSIAEGNNFSYREYHREIQKTGEAYVSSVFKNSLSGESTIAVVVPVQEDSEMIGYIVGLLDLDHITRHLKELQEESELLVLDRRGDPVISTEYDLVNLDIQVLLDDYEIDRLRQNVQGDFSFTETNIHEKNYIVGYKEYGHFSLIYAKHSNVIYYMIYSIFMTVIAFAGISLFIFGILIHLTSGSIAKPIKELSNKVDKITKGNLDIHLKKSNILEIDNLVDSLNRILASLKLAILRTGAQKSDFGIGEVLQAKKKAEKRFSIIFESAPRGIFTVKDKKVTSWNKRAEEITGYNDKEVVGKEVSLFIKDIDKCLQSSNPTDRRECVFRTKAGEEIIVSLNKEKIEDDRGEMMEEIVIFDDITKRAKKQQEAEFKSKQMYALLEEMNDHIYVSDMDTYEIIFANKAIREAYGVELLGKKCYEALQGKKRPCSYCTNKEIKKLKGKPYIWEFYNPVLKRNFQLTDRLIRWPDGRDVRFEIAHDITEKQKEEKYVQEVSSKLEVAMSVSNLAWWEMELPSGKVSFNVNKAKMLGYSKSRFKTYKDFMKLVHPDDHGKVMKAMKDHLQGKKKKYKVKYRIKTRSGKYKTFRDVGVITEKTKDNTKVVGIVEAID